MVDAYIEAEAKSLEILKRELQESKVKAYEMLRMLVIGDLKLQYSGYKSIEEATINIIGDVARENEKKIRAHEKKYPDRGE